MNPILFNIKDVILETFSDTSGALSLSEVLLNFAAAALISVLIFISYKISHSGPVYSQRFNVSLIMLTLVTTLVMNVIGNNIALSLGMVGALSIVRFRTAIKDPRDTAYIFWGIAVGICCGVSDYLIAGVGSVIIFLFLILFGFVKNNERIMIVTRMNKEALTEMEKEMKIFFSGKAMLRMCNISDTSDFAETIYEVSDDMLISAQKEKGSVANSLSSIKGVQSVSIVRQDDEINQ